MSSENRVNLAVVGSGPAGLAAALGLAGLGQPCRLIGPAPDPNDPRTAALFTGSIAMLRHLGVWDACRAASAPIRAIRIVDDTGGLLRAPETLFTAAEAGEDAVADGVLGYNVPNAALTRALVEKVRAEPRLEWTAARVAGIAIDADTARMMLDSGATYRPGLCARLVAAADGRGSLCRAAAGIGTRTWTHDQAALVTSFTHGRPHHDISTELHRRGGPLTVVPLPGRASSLVWVDRPAPIAALAALDDAGFRASLEGRLQGLLGSLGEIAPRRAFQLSGMTATRFAASRVALVGETGHVFPPIGAQGLNLGLRDGAVLVDVVEAALAAGEDPGGPEVMKRYHDLRDGDIRSRTLAVSVLGASLTSGATAVDLARGVGLHLISRLPALKRALIREGLGPRTLSPKLMRADGA